MNLHWSPFRVHRSCRGLLLGGGGGGGRESSEAVVQTRTILYVQILERISEDF